jgi:catechol 2,3-dioxygenase-like lactoylglutathione lyase family enzyme
MSNRFIAHLAHVEVLTPCPEESLTFYREVLGLEESGREGQSVYLRGWGEWSYHSLQLTEAAEAGIGHVGWRTCSPADLEGAIRRVDAAGAGEGWFEESVGHGPRTAIGVRAATFTSCSGSSNATRRRRRCAPRFPRARSATPRAVSHRARSTM